MLDVAGTALRYDHGLHDEISYKYLRENIMSLASKLTVIFLLLSIVPLSLVGYLAYDEGRHSIEQDATDHLLTTSLLKEAEFMSWLEFRRMLIRSMPRSVSTIYTSVRRRWTLTRQKPI